MSRWSPITQILPAGTVMLKALPAGVSPEMMMYGSVMATPLTVIEPLGCSRRRGRRAGRYPLDQVVVGVVGQQADRGEAVVDGAAARRCGGAAESGRASHRGP